MATELCLNVRAILRAGVDCGELLAGCKALADIFQVVLQSQEGEASQALNSN